MKLVHSEEFHSAKENKSKTTTLQEVSPVDGDIEVRGEGEIDNISKIFDPYKVLSKTTSKTSLCWKFFFFKGTETDGPDKTRVYYKNTFMELPTMGQRLK